MPAINISQTRVEQSYTVTAGDLNHYGLAHGGRLLTLADNIGYIAARGFCCSDCLTVAVHNARFHRPLKENARLTLRAEVALSGGSSLWTPVSICEQGRNDPAMEAILVYVAVDKAMRPVTTRAVSTRSEAERSLQLDILSLKQFVTGKKSGA